MMKIIIWIQEETMGFSGFGDDDLPDFEHVRSRALNSLIYSFIKYLHLRVVRAYK